MKLRFALILLTFISAGLSQTAFAQDSAALDAALAAQSDEHKARYQYRHPKETLEFFGIEPGMAVGEALPGGGWYSKILIPYLGADGSLFAIDYPIAMYGEFGPNSFANEEFLKKKETWAEDWVETAQAWNPDSTQNITAATFSSIPDEMAGTLDAVVYFRALHNLSRFNEKGGYLDRALASTFKALKPGGIVGVVQHHARDDRPDAWANGENGYLKRGFIVEQFTKAGFQLIGESDINSNELDQAKEGDSVWRLLPSFKPTGDEEADAAITAIGESNRQTLKFVKPAG